MNSTEKNSSIDHLEILEESDRWRISFIEAVSAEQHTKEEMGVLKE